MNKALYIWVLSLVMVNTITALAQPKPDILIDNLIRASAIDISPNSELFIVEAGRNRVIKYDLEGKLLDTFGGRGSGESQFDNPGSIDVTNGLKLFVTDIGNKRIQVFDNRFQFIGSYSSVLIPKYRFDPSFISVDEFGNLFTYLHSDHLILRFGITGRPDVEIGPLQNYGIEKVTGLINFNDQIILIDAKQGILFRFSKEGEYLNFISGFPEIHAVSSDQNYIYLVNRNTVFIVDSQGNVAKEIPILASTFTGISIWKGMIYLLTESRLFRYRL